MKHLLYFAGYKMVVFRWEQGKFTGYAEFDPNEHGYHEFKRFLTKEVKQPLRLLVDIIEEDFRVETVPHVYGKDKKAIRQRAINKQFRQYQHTLLLTQGREEQGRRDDIVLLSALTNYKLFKNWLDILHDEKLPLEGIYTLPLVSEGILKALNATKGGVLIISQQMPSNTRQSFYVNGSLKLSRLAPSRDDANLHYQVLADETDRTLKFLENQHFITPESELHIYIIAHRGEHEELASVFHEDVSKHYHIIDRDALAIELGVKSMMPGKYSNWIYAHLLLQNKKLKPHYGTDRDKKYFRHYISNRVMLAASAAVLLVGLFLSGISLFNVDIHMDEIERHKAGAIKYSNLYKNVIKEISELSLDVNDVKDAVDISELIQKKYGNLPHETLMFLSSVLHSHSDIKIDKLKWLTTFDENHSLGEKKQLKMDPISIRMRILQGNTVVNNTLYEKMLIDAYVTNFNNNPRIAIEKVTAFINSLQIKDQVNHVQILKMPYDIASGSRFTGKGVNSSGSRTSNDAKFSFVVIKEKEII